MDPDPSAYVFTNRSSCKKCPAVLDWYLTPKGKKIPLTAIDGDPHPPDGFSIPAALFGTAVKPRVHFGDCPGADDVRRETEARRSQERPARNNPASLAAEFDAYLAGASPDAIAGAAWAFSYCAKVAQRFADQVVRRLPE
jgi:hypothetical protein